MSGMNAPGFNTAGAMDLSALKAKANAPKPPAGGRQGGSGGGSYVTEVTGVPEFEALLQKSQQYPIIVEFHSPRAQGGDQLTATLTKLANEARGKYLLARVDCDAHAEIAQALGVQGVPTVVAVIGGQLAPLFQGVQPEQQVRGVIDQLMQAAVSNGIVGTADPVGGAPAEDGADEADPRFAAADAALEQGDFETAVAEFDKLLAENPNDAEAQAGKAQAGLLARTMKSDPQQVLAKAEQNPDDVEAQQDAADVELAQGQSEKAFNRLIEVVRKTSGDERDAVRKRLLELFETLGNSDPAVLKARRALMTALF